MALPTRPIVIFDTNVFHADAEAERSKLESVLDGVLSGDFELVVPRVVLDELERQYPRRIKKAVRAINKAIGGARRELVEMGVDPPDRFGPDHAGDEYRERLINRLEQHGAVVREPPADLTPALEWAVKRRRPFKDTGVGFPDAAIWLTVVDVARERQGSSVLFVSTNTKDFGDGATPLGLADELRADLVAFGLDVDAVGLVEGLDRFLDRFAEPLASADSRAQRLLDEEPSSTHITAAIGGELDFRHVPAAQLALGVSLEDEAQIVAYEVGELDLQLAEELQDGRLRLDLRAEVEVTVEAHLYKADAYVEVDDSYVDVTDWDYSHHYVEVSATVVLLADVEVTTDLEAEQPEADLLDFRLAPDERASRALSGDAGEYLAEFLRMPPKALEIKVENYLPDVPLLSDLEEANVDEIRTASVRSVEVDDVLDENTLALRVRVDAEADIDWHVSAMDPTDAERFADVAENVEHGGGFLQDTESYAPLELEVTAMLTGDSLLSDIEVAAARLQPRQAELRRHRRDEADPVMQAFGEWADEQEDEGAF